MKPITEYHDYRTYMRDFYEERKRVSYFTWRQFASLAGFVSPTYLKLVCDGKTRLSKPGIEKVARAMGLEGFDYTYFGLLVKFGNAKNAAEKEAALRELEREARLIKVRIVDADAFHYFENPACPIVRELAPIMPESDPGEIAAHIRSKTTALDVREILQFLVKAGFLLKTGKGTYEQTEKSVKGSKEAIPLAMRSMNREMGRGAQLFRRHHGHRRGHLRADCRGDRRLPQEGGGHRTRMPEHQSGVPPEPATFPAYG